MKAAIIRPCMIYGEDEPHVLKKLLFLVKKRLFPLLDNGDGKFHLVYIKNVIDFIIFCIDNDNCLQGSFFVADDEVMTTREIFDIITDAIGAKRPFRINPMFSPLFGMIPFVGKKMKFFVKNRVNGSKDRVYSLEKSKAIGFVPKYGLADSLMKSCKALSNSKKQSCEGKKCIKNLKNAQ